MGRKKALEKRLQRLMAKKTKLNERAAASTDAAEVRALTEELEDVNAEINETQEEIDAIDEEEREKAPQGEERQNPPAGAQLVNGNVIGSFSQQAGASQERSKEDPYATLEYRQSFMRYVQGKEQIPAKYIEQRDGISANTTDLGATIPTTVLNEFINEVRLRYGQLYNKVRKLNIQGNLRVPIAKLQAQFKWITESTVSPRQNGGTINEYVQFGYNMCEIRVSQTLLSSIVTLDLFEREIINVMVIAFLEAMDDGIINGTGEGQMLGILNDPRVLATNNVIEMTAAQMSDWTAWRKNFFAKLPLGYRAGEFIFPLATVDAYLETMQDSNGNPIFRQATGLEVNDGDSRNPNGRFFGRDITLVEPNIIPDFDNASSGDVIGVFWQPEEYAINTNMQMGLKRWFDDDKNEWVNKMLAVVDGKMLNVKGVWLIKKK